MFQEFSLIRKALRVLLVQVLAIGLLFSGLSVTMNLPKAFALTALPNLNLSAWGAVSNTSLLNISSPVLGASTNGLTTANTSGGGTILSTYNSGNPYSRLSVLSAFNGGKVVEMSQGSNATHALAAVINRSGAYEVWGWGSNTQYELGLGNSDKEVRFNPTKTTWTAGTNEEIVELATGTSYSLMLTRNSVTGATKVYGWGLNSSSQLGIGGASAGKTIGSPTEITTLSSETIVDISAGPLHSFAVDQSGNVWAWGYDHLTHRPLGLITAISASDPVEFPVKLDATNAGSGYPRDILEIESGHYFSAARSATGLYTWGYQGGAGPGKGSTSTSSPAQPGIVTLAGCNSPDDVSVGYSTVAIICANETSYAWGSNNYRQAGVNSTTATITTPTELPFTGIPAGVTPVSVDLGTRIGLALLSNGAIWSWGTNYGHLLGKSTSTALTATQLTPAATTRISVSGSTPIDIWADQDAAGVIMQDSASDTELYTWGVSTASTPLTGRGSVVSSGASLQATFDRVGVTPGSYIRLMDTTMYSTVIVMSDNSIWSWGTGNSTANRYLGDGAANRFYPGKLVLPFGPDTATPNETVYDLDCGEYHCLISTGSGKIFGWGAGESRQLIPSSPVDKGIPTQISTGHSATTKVAAGTAYSLLLDSGAVKAWGTNNNGRAIPGGSASYSTITTVTGLSSGVVDLDAGSNFSIALLSDGSIRTWGANTAGQLGNGTITAATSLQTPTLGAGVVPVEVKASGQSVICKTAAGTWISWGANSKGILGLTNATTPMYTPTEGRLPGDRRVAAIAFAAANAISVEYFGAYAIDTEGYVWSWGSNYLGQSGTNTNRTTTTILNPTQVLKTGGTQISGQHFVIAGSGWGGSWSIPSAAVSTELPRPSAPTSPSATQSDGAITLTWSAPTTTASLRSYTAILKNASGIELARKSVSSSTTSVQFTESDDNVANGTSYKVAVLAVNQNGEGDSTSDLSITPLGVPDSPASVLVTPTVSGVNITWAASPDDEGSAITGYKVQVFDSSSVQIGSTTTISAGSTLSLSVTTGLTVGTSYLAKVIATNAVGDSAPRISSFVVVGRPSAPRNVSAEPRLSGAYVTWDAPSYSGGASVAAYLVRVYANDHVAGDTPISTATVTSGTSTTLTGLTDGTDYDVTVLASQDSGTTLLGLESDSVDIRPGRPDTPTGLSVTASNQAITASWNASRTISGLDPTHYSISAVPSSGITVQTLVSASSACSGTNCQSTLTGLTNGITYTVSIYASLSSQLSAGSVAVTAIPRTVPGAPTSTSLSAGDTSLSLTWEPPTSTGGSAITSYALVVTDAASANVLTVSLDQSARAYDIPGLSNGASYTAAIAAINIAGQGSSSTQSAVPVGLPGEPLGLSIEPRATSLIATWQAPTDTGGSAITSYGLEVTDSSSGIVTSYSTSSSAECASSSTTTTCTIAKQDDDGDELDSTVTTPTVRTNLPANNSFTVKVKATNAQGDSSWTSVEAAATTGQPSAPRNLTLTHGNSKFTVCFQEPQFVLSQSITKYQIIGLDSAGGVKTKTVPIADLSSTSSCPSPKLAYEVQEFDNSTVPQNGESYTVSLTATLSSSASDITWGAESAGISVTPKTRPSTVRSFVANAGSSQVTLSWSTPSSNGGGDITGYHITYKPVSGTDLTTHSPAPTSSSTSATIIGLTNAVEYEFNIYAVNSEGQSIVSQVTATPRSLASNNGPSSNSPNQSSNDSGSVNQKAQTTPKIPTSLKKGKKFKVSSLTSAQLSYNLVSTNTSCKVSKVFKTTKVKVGKKTVKRKTQTGWIVQAKKKPGCMLTVSNSGNTEYAALNNAIQVTVR